MVSYIFHHVKLNAKNLNVHPVGQYLTILTHITKQMFMFIKYLIPILVFNIYYYGTSNNYFDIGGTWIRSAKNIHYSDNKLCTGNVSS